MEGLLLYNTKFYLFGNGEKRLWNVESRLALLFPFFFFFFKWAQHLNKAKGKTNCKARFLCPFFFLL